MQIINTDKDRQDKKYKKIELLESSEVWVWTLLISSNLFWLETKAKKVCVEEAIRSPNTVGLNDEQQN